MQQQIQQQLQQAHQFSVNAASLCQQVAQQLQQLSQTIQYGSTNTYSQQPTQGGYSYVSPNYNQGYSNQGMTNVMEADKAYDQQESNPSQPMYARATSNVGATNMGGSNIGGMSPGATNMGGLGAVMQADRYSSTM